MKYFLRTVARWHSGTVAQLSSSRGFSLLEIMIALAILATVTLGLMSAQGTSFLASERAERLTQATFLAQQKMVEVEIELEKDMEKNKFPDEEQKTGTFDEPFDDFRWAYAIKKVEIPLVSGGEESKDPAVGGVLQEVMDKISKSVREVELTVYWGDQDKPLDEQMKMTLTTHVVNPKAE